MGELASAPGFYYELGGKFDSSSHFKFNGTVPGSSGATVDMQNVKLTDSYWSLGAAYEFILQDTLSLGAHLEARGEYLQLAGQVSSSIVPTYEYSQTTTYLRPWVRLSGDYTFLGAGHMLRPFVGVEGAVAITKTTQTETPNLGGPIDGRTLKAMAPRYSYAAYAGVRF